MRSSRCALLLAGLLPLAVAACEQTTRTLDEALADTGQYACERAMAAYEYFVEEFRADSDTARADGGRTAFFGNVSPERRRAMEAKIPLLTSGPLDADPNAFTNITYAVDGSCRTSSSVEFLSASGR